MKKLLSIEYCSAGELVSKRVEEEASEPNFQKVGLEARAKDQAGSSLKLSWSESAGQNVQGRRWRKEDKKIED